MPLLQTADCMSVGSLQKKPFKKTGKQNLRITIRTIGSFLDYKTIRLEHDT